MRSIYYNIELLRKNRYEYIGLGYEYSYNIGFLKIVQNNESFYGQGILTMDLLEIYTTEDGRFNLKYFVPSDDFKSHVLDIQIQFEGKLPLTFKADTGKLFIQVNTFGIIKDSVRKEECDRKLEKIKNSDVFLGMPI